MKRRLNIDAAVWRRLMGQEEGPPLPFQPPWWETMTPLAVDCEIALEKLHMTPGMYYRQTTFRERLLIRLHLAYRSEQQRAAQEADAQRQADLEDARRRAHGQG